MNLASSLRTYMEDRTFRSRAALLRDARAIIENEYATVLELDEIALRIASSRRNVQRSFELLGTTFRDFVTQVRMQRAAELLGMTNLSVRQVANRVGYRQPAQFAKTYRRQFGLSPTEFRRQLDASRAAMSHPPGEVLPLSPRPPRAGLRSTAAANGP